MRQLALTFAVGIALSITAPAQATTTILSENFSSGLGAFTAIGQVGPATGNDYITCCGTFGSPANMSNPFVAFGSGDLASGTLQATLSTQAAILYTVSFDLGTLGSGADPLIVSENAAVIGIFSVSATDNLDATFVPFQAAFLASGPTTILEFQSLGTKSADAVLDNVKVSTLANVPGGVPEPATWAMMLLGFGAVAAGIRINRKKRLASA